MKCHLKFICRNEDRNDYGIRTDRFFEYCKAQIIRREIDVYWKNKNCSVIDVQFDCDMTEDIKDAVRKIFSVDSVVCTETDEEAELGVYSSLDEIINDGKVFLTLYMKK